MMYLEDLLKTMKEDANVLVTLSSHTTYGQGINAMTFRDHCGNHYTENWLVAISENHLEKVFVVEDVKVTFESYMESPQWEVFLQNEKSHSTLVLDRESNQVGIRRIFGWL